VWCGCRSLAGLGRRVGALKTIFQTLRPIQRIVTTCEKGEAALLDAACLLGETCSAARVYLGRSRR